MTMQSQKHNSTKRTFWTVAVFYFLIAFEFFYMASPFAIYFYSAYGPGLRFVNDNPTLAWLCSMFLPHIAEETSSYLLNLRNIVGAILALLGFLAFCLGAGQVYYHKLTRKGAVIGGIYNIIRHPQYASLALCSFGLLLLWPRYIVLLSFVAMLFAYYFLAKVEEGECEERFGEAYTEYKNRTGMFLPVHLSLADKLPNLPKSGLKRCLAILMLYLVISVSAIGLANGLRNWSLNSLYALYSQDAVYVSIKKVEANTLKQIVKIALANPEVHTRLAIGGNAKYLNYIMPAELDVSEIPMNPIAGKHQHHFLRPPGDYHAKPYKIVFTRAEQRTNRKVEGRGILLNTVKRVPLLEVQIDLIQNQVTEIKNPPANIKYENIPVPLY